MAKKDAYFICVSCKKQNWINLDLSLVGNQKIILYCCKCGKVNEPQKVEDEEGESWLPCVKFGGIEKDDVAGVQVSRTGAALWTDTDGKHLTREDFAEQHGVDPWTIWCSVPANQNKEVCQGWATRCQATRKVKLNKKTDSDVPSVRL